ncbi:MAG TPA: response regulator transcription factor [Chthoniobacteraceae bacterium]|jgi:DNA-binding response OmpR family regulator|nr:response regulator transcription factor [Chthoniobacteraceae bacterium]
MRILVVEDERKLASFLRQGLVEEGFAVDVIRDGDEALACATSTPYDALVLDIMLPGRDGLSILRTLREQRSNVPVLLLSARSNLAERVEGLNLGADDFLPKPFSISEVIARLRALLRRASGDRNVVLQHGDLSLNLVQREAARAGKKIELTAKEFALLEYLMRSPGRVLTRTSISESVWDYHFDPESNVIEVYVQRLRRKIDDGHEVKLLHTVRGVGYSLR